VEVASDPRLGTDLLGYRLEAVLGRGGMGVVYRAHDPRLKRDVALKLLAPEYASDERFRERFLSETERAASLEHPNVIPIHDAGEVDGQLYLAMRLADGGDLKKLLADQGSLERRRVVAICGQLADALDAAHARGLVHRDVKPSNVLLDERGHAYLADFGLSRRLSDQAPGFEAGLSLGTPAYVAPEQIEGNDVDGRTDQYSLACLLYECLTGSPPYPRGSEAAVLFAHLEEPPPTPRGLEDVMRRGLAKVPGDRYDSCSELVAAVRDALGVTDAPRPRWPVVAGAIAMVLVIAAVGAALVLTGADNSAGPPQSGRLLRIDPGTSRAEEVAVVGSHPSALATGNDRIWITAFREGGLWLFDPRTSAVTKLENVGRPHDVAVYGGSAYVSATGPSQFGGNVSKYDAATGAKVDGLELRACGLTAGAEGVWVAACTDVVELSSSGPGSGLRMVGYAAIPYPRALTSANFREGLSGIATDRSGVWVLGDPADRRLWRIDPATRRIAATIRLAFAPRSIAVGEGGTWITDQLDDAVVRVDPRTYRITDTIPVGRGASAITVGAGSVWVANTIDRTLMRIDPTARAVVETIDLPGRPEDIAADAGSVWLAVDAS
jgi:streptogramin lyase